MSAALKLFGMPQVRVAKHWENLALEKGSGLLLYVAAHPKGVTRGVLASVFWSETDDTRARANLRQLLTRMRRSKWSSAVKVTEDHVLWCGSSDLDTFWKSLKSGLVLETFTSEFLEGFLLSDAPAFMEWLELERQTIRHAWREAALQRVRTLDDQVKALEILGLVLRVEELCEEAVQFTLKLSAGLGQPDIGRAAFVRFQKTLQHELGLQPLAETISLYAQLEQKPVVQAPRISLPASSTPFIGRNDELKALEVLLESGSRCVSLVAPGGMGKTRLALRVAQEWAASFEDGVVFASTLGLSGQAALASALLEGFGIGQRQADSVSQLLTTLEPKRALLILDNLESDVITAAELVSQILSRCSRVCLVLTSRERLGLSGETVLDLGGLSPQAAESLFVASARRADPYLTLDAKLQMVVARIAEHCAYMPLALELAASWAAVLDLTDLEHEVLSSLNYLESRFHDTPERHRSIRAVLTQTWGRLQPQLRQVLGLLAPLEGGFSLSMAKGIAKASLRDLETLIARSLLSRNGQRYAIHELLRQFMLEQPEANPNPAKIWMLSTVKDLQKHRRSPKTLAQLEDEVANLRWVMWQYLDEHNLEAVKQLCLALDDVYDTRGLSLEAKQVFTTVLSRLPSKSSFDSPSNSSFASPSNSSFASPSNSSFASELYKFLGSYTMRLSQPLEAEAYFTKALELNIEPQSKASVLSFLGQLKSRAGEWQQAEQFFLKGLEIYQQFNDPIHTAECLNGLGVNAKLRGELSQAQEYLEQAIVLNEKAEHFEGAAIAMLNLANVHESQGQDQAALSAYNRCLAHFQQLGHKRGIAVVLNNLSIVQRKLGNLLAARVSLETSLHLKREMHDKRGIAVALQSLAELETMQNKSQEAHQYLLESIQMGLDANAIPTVMQSFHAMAETLFNQGQLEQAALIWRAVAAHPATSGQIQQAIATKLPAELASGKTLALPELLANLQVRL